MIIDNAVYKSLMATLTSTGELERVVSIFNRNIDHRLNSLKDAYTQDERSGIKHLAHSLKGSCAMFGATRCADLCQQIENAALTVDQPLPPDLLENFLSEMSEFRNLLDENIAASRAETRH